VFVNMPGVLNRVRTRREVLAGSVAAILGASGLQAAKSRITKARLSAITDEIGRTQSDSVAFAKQYGLQWVELRTVPESRKEFALLSEPELKRFNAELAAGKLKVSLLKTSLLKFPWPELSPDHPELDANRKRWDRRKDDLAKAITAAQIFGVDKVRIFTGARVARPATAYPVIARAIEDLIPMAEAAKVRLLIENEPSQNIGTCAEIKAILELLPSKSIGFNWDAQNALSLIETPWPGGYAELPKERMLNVQIKAEGLSLAAPRNADASQQIDWRAVMEQMQHDGYQGVVSLATETFDGTFERANDAMREVMHLVGELA
jgi:sugar phosphate isomerase/epimerase